MEEYLKDKDSFTRAYEEYAEAIFRYCVFRVSDRERSLELMQETFTKTWEYICKGREVKNLKAFLYKVAHNLCVNEIVRRRTYSLDAMRENTGFDLEDDKVQKPEDAGEISILLKNLGMLNSGDRDILEMRYIDDLKVSEIAEILDTLPNTISVRIHRAEIALKNIYQRHGR